MTKIRFTKSIPSLLEGDYLLVIGTESTLRDGALLDCLPEEHMRLALDLLTDLNRARGTTIAMVLHDLNLAARYADRLVALRAGRLHAAGDPADVLTADVVRDVFGMESQVVPDPVSGRPIVLPIGRHHVRPAVVSGTAAGVSAASAAGS